MKQLDTPQLSSDSSAKGDLFPNKVLILEMNETCRGMKEGWREDWEEGRVVKHHIIIIYNIPIWNMFTMDHKMCAI